MSVQLHPSLNSICKVFVYDANGRQMLSSVMNSDHLGEMARNWWKNYLPKGLYQAFVFDAHQNKTSYEFTID